MRSYCRVSDAELAVNDLAKAREYAHSSLPFLNEFSTTSPSLLVQRDVGLCYESLGNVQRQMAMSRSASPAERKTAAAAARQWYLKSDAVWNEYHTRRSHPWSSTISRERDDITR